MTPDATDAPIRRGIFDAALLDTCISCGFCLPACPTYALTQDEAASPRGRINLMRALETGALPDDDATLAEQVSLCLGCRACEPVCPAGVQYGALLEQWRDHQWTGVDEPLIARAAKVAVDQPWALRLAGSLRGHARTESGEGPSLMLGCLERSQYPQVSRAVLRLRPEICAPSDQGCCGALHAHNGDSVRGEEMARELGEKLPGTIVVTAGGCAAHLSHVLGRERVKEFSEYVVEQVDAPVGEVLVDGRRARVTFQDSCHLRNGMGVTAQPRELIARVADLVEISGAGKCCGSAGTYFLLRRKESRLILDAKIDEIEAAGVDYVVTVNPICTRQLASGLRRRRSKVRVLHLAELLTRVSNSAATG